MRILFVEPFGHRAGHYSVLSKQLTNALVEAGVNVTMVTYNGFWDNWTENSKIDRYISVVSRYGPLSPLLRQISKLHRFPLLGLFADFVETLLTPLLALREARRQSYDAIHIFDGNPIFLPLAIALFTRDYNFVFQLHSPSLEGRVKGGLKKFSELLRRRDYQRCLQLAMLRLFQVKPLQLWQRMVYRKARRRNNFSFISYTSEIKESFKAYSRGIFYDKTYVIPLGRELPKVNSILQFEARQYLNLPQEVRVFLCFGANHPTKNLEVIFQATQDMPKDFYILYTGKLLETGEARDPVVLARKYGQVKNTVVVNKFIPDEEVPYYFYASDAILLSFDKSFLCASGTLNDAGQFQLPVIASDVGQVGEYVRRYNLGVTFVPDDAESLRQAIEAFLSLTDEERLVLKDNLGRFASTFDTAEMARRYIALYSGEFNGGEV